MSVVDPATRRYPKYRIGGTSPSFKDPLLNRVPTSVSPVNDATQTRLRTGDLSRYFGGDINFDTVSASAVEWYEKPGHLSQIQIDENKIPEEHRLPRFTSASW